MNEHLVYEQETGNLFYYEKGVKTKVGQGYSGAQPHVNQPSAQAIKSVGPLPVGVYRTHWAFDHSRLGPVAIFLEPDDDNEMFGRSGFFIHGDNGLGNQTASHGCIILPRKAREQINRFGPVNLYVCINLKDFLTDCPF